MLVLDTDHFSELERGSPAGQRLRERLEASSREKVLTIITVEEQMRGWLAQINRDPDIVRQISSYARLQRQVEVFSCWTVLPWSAEAAGQFGKLRSQGVRTGTMDLKIACIVLTYEALLLTRNTADFAHIPGLRQENWLG